MLSKGAMEIVRDKLPGFYSHLFLVDKVSGGWRPLLDQSALNTYLNLETSWSP